MGCSTSALDVNTEKILEKTVHTELKVSVKSVKYRPEKEFDKKGSNGHMGNRNQGKLIRETL